MTLVKMIDNTIVTTSKIVSNGVEIQHKNVIALIERHHVRIANLRKGVLPFETDKPKKGSKGGRPEKYYILNEIQTTFLISLMKNTEIVLNFKENLVKEFFRMRKALLESKLNKQNEQWLEARKEGKNIRKNTTGVYKEYLEYAIQQGSKNYKKRPDNVYINFTKMINKALFDFEFKIPKGESARDYMTTNQLTITSTAELAAQRLIHKEIDKGTHYKEIYTLVKKEMEQYSNFIGKSTIIDLLTSNEKENEFLLLK